MLRWPIALLLLCFLTALFLVNRERAQWPAFMFVVLALLHVFSLAFSKGATLRLTAVGTLLYTAGWFAWWLARDAELWRKAGFKWTPIVLWGLGFLYALLLGTTRGQRFHRGFATFFLTSATLVLGMWAVLCADVQYGLGYSWLPSAALLAAAFTPLLAIVIDIAAGGQTTRLPATFSAALGAVSTYLAVVEVVIRALNHLEQTLPSRVLGRPERAWPDPWWFELLPWRVVVGTAGAVAAGAILLASSVTAVSADFSRTTPDFLLPRIEYTAARLTSSADPASRVAEHTRLVVLRAARSCYLAALFIGRVAAELADELAQAALRLGRSLLAAIRWFLLPLACFSTIALLLISVIHSLVSEVPQPTATAQANSSATIWGGLVCAAAVVLTLCGLAFSLAAVSPTRLGSRNALLPASVIAALFGMMMTLATPLLWFLSSALGRVHIHPAGLGLGPLVRANLIVVLVCVTAIVIAVLANEGFTTGAPALNPTTATAPNRRLVLAGLIVPLALTGLFAVISGHGLLSSWIDSFS
ncbi:hypothetical protein ACFQ9X_33700 [Catenulispora yoronensis]